MLKKEPVITGTALTLTLVIPTYRREEVLLESIRSLFQATPPPDELIVVDQTADHEPLTEQTLAAWHDEGRIRWLRRSQPSIPQAMNAGLLAAVGDVVLFVDDDIRPDQSLVGAHLRAQLEHPGLVAGQVLQPGERPLQLAAGQAFRFNSAAPAWIEEFMGGNFSVRRVQALELGGFDENFVGAAYRFEAEFAHRYRKQHGLIRYESSASIHHLRIASGGTRAHGHHLRTAKPGHSVGAYYYLLRTRVPGWGRQLIIRPLRSVRTRHHLLNPWWIPVTLVAELRGLWQALCLSVKGPRLVKHGSPRVEAPG